VDKSKQINPYIQGGPKKVSHDLIIKKIVWNRIEDCQWD